jgi:rubredoxin
LILLTEFEEKVIDLLETINEKLDKVLEGSSTPAASASTAATTSSGSGAASIETSSGKKPSEVVEKQENEEKEKEAPPIEGRRVCPKCGGTDFKEVEDKSRILHQQGGMKIYAKNHVCKNCGYKFPA